MPKEVIDIHAHFTPLEWIEGMRRDGARHGCHIEEDASGRLSLRVGDGRPSSLQPFLSDLPARVSAMRERGLDRQVLSPPMTIVTYQLEGVHGQAVSRLFNETNAEAARGTPGLIPVATVPMQAGREAVEELRYAVEVLGIPMVEIGTHINGVNLDDEAFRPFFECAADLGVLVQLHPHRVAAAERLSRYYMNNLVGNPVDTAIAAASLILGGVMERYPSLNICLVHGGGALPYLLGRVIHGHGAVDAARAVPGNPETYFRRFYFDTILHDPRMLTFLHQLAGEERLLLGTDYPYDMGERDPLGLLERAGLGDSDAVRGGNAARLLGLRNEAGG
ncbi:MAG: amidohydrolase family protein [Deltaproteobacteria bacterium]|nr:amidohydrolase family protein [Deltaproteobacteria bacterium]